MYLQNENIIAAFYLSLIYLMSQKTEQAIKLLKFIELTSSIGSYAEMEIIKLLSQRSKSILSKLN